MANRARTLSQRERDEHPERFVSRSAEDSARRRNDPAQVEAERLRHSDRWRRLRRIVLARRPFCVVCSTDTVLVPAAEVDHIVALVDGGAPFDERNLQSLCSPCHHTKSAREVVDRRGRAVPTAMLDPKRGEAR